MTSYRHLKIIVGLVLIFAAGAVTGSIVTHQMIKRVFEKSLKFENWTAGAVAHIDKKLHLTADQKAKIREIMEDTGKQLQSVFSKTMKESGQILVQSGKRVDQVLTPEQRAIHNEMKTQAVAKENRRALFTFDLKTGKELWQAGVTFEGKEPTNHQNPYCSASAGHRRTASGGLLRHPPAFTVMTSPVKSSGTARSGRSIPGTGAVRRPSSTVDYAT